MGKIARRTALGLAESGSPYGLEQERGIDEALSKCANKNRACLRVKREKVLSFIDGSLREY